MRVRRKSNGQVLVLTDAQLLGKGGEARVFKPAEDPSLAAKIWHKATAERAAKIAVMTANPPVNPTASQHHSSIAWPMDILESVSAKPATVGFLMPLVTGMSPVIDFFNPRTRRQKCPLFNWFYLHRTARNLVIAVKALHERNYVIGDLNESNVLVAETALVTIVDTDSFQVWDPANRTLYRCRVGKPEFTPPEMQGKTFGDIDRNVPQDLFGLGIILFQLLMEGTHPFAGNYTGTGEPPPYETRIAAGHFPYAYGSNVPYLPKTTAPAFETLYPLLQNMFIRCFQDGHLNPAARPDTQAWQWALEEAENSLVTCWVNDQHVYSGHLQACPWCARAKLLGGRDPYPSVEAVKSGKHLAPPPVAKTPMAVPPKSPLTGASHLPPPPIPRRVPPPSVPGGKGKPFAGFPAPRNDLAWGGLVASAFSLFFLTSTFGFLMGMMGLLFGLAGEIQSHGWFLDGRGRIPARVAMVLGAISVAAYWLGNLRAILAGAIPSG